MERPKPPDPAYIEFGGDVVDQDGSAVRVYAARCRAQGLPCLVGLDFEWPHDCVGENNPLALVQVATPDTVVLVRVDPLRRELPAWLKDLLLDPTIVKCVAGFDVLDRRKLLQCGVQVAQREDQGLLDVAQLAAELGDAVPSIGLRKLCHFFGYPIRKARRVAMSDWAASKTGVLTHEQRQYAADDAVFTLAVCGHLLEANARTPFRHRCLDAWRRLHPRLVDSIRVVPVNKTVIDDNWLLRSAADWDQASVSAASTHDTETRSWEPMHHYPWAAQHQQLDWGWEPFPNEWCDPSFTPPCNEWDPNPGGYYSASFEGTELAGYGQPVSAGGCVYYS